ncbi:hypothetical protein [Streptomyces odonnellii]|uniref:hypothetical protein n=1 Tax=Streptomyces odonnellii TaxID=1417980 RepID=UPI000A881D5A|nr:hypothetical protein [Streptomyces odonnellii]
MLLHLTPALLLIALTETIAAYRRCGTNLLDQIGPAGRTDAPALHTLVTPEQIEERPDPATTEPDPPNTPNAVDRTAGHRAEAATLTAHVEGHAGPHTGDRTPHSYPSARGSQPINDGATEADVWPRAITLNNIALHATGNRSASGHAPIYTSDHDGPTRSVNNS